MILGPGSETAISNRRSSVSTLTRSGLLLSGACTEWTVVGMPATVTTAAR